MGGKVNLFKNILTSIETWEYYYLNQNRLLEECATATMTGSYRVEDGFCKLW